MEEENTNINYSTTTNSNLEKLDVYSEILPSAEKELHNVRYGFIASGLNFLIRKDTLSEIANKPKVFPVPNGPTSIHGLINHRGNLIPVFKFRTFIQKQTPEKANNFEYVLVLDAGEKGAAFYIDNIPFTINAEENEFITSEYKINDISNSAEQFIDNVFEINEKILIDFDFERFFHEITTAPS